VGTLWGEEVDLTGRDLMAASRISTRAGIKIRARWWPGLTTRHYLKDGTRKLLIHSVQNVGNRNAELRLLCEEVQQ
jgi:head-tail adaptor